MAQRESKDHLLQLIPKDQLSSEQKAFRQRNSETSVPWYTMRREPTRLEDVDWYDAIYADDHQSGYYDLLFVIWRENGTIICICDRGSRNLFEERNVRCTISDVDDKLCEEEYVIYGKSDAAIAETANFFWSLKDEENTKCRLKISTVTDRIDFSALQPELLARVFDANPTRYFEFEEGTWSAEQSVILATRQYPLNIKLSCCDLEDKGTAFVDALEKRQKASFESFSLVFWSMEDMPFNSDNLKRFFELNIAFEKLEMPMLNEECAFLPLSAKTNSLKYEIELTHIEPDDFDSLDIVANDLDLKISLGRTFEWDEHLISLFNRVAQSGHFESLRFSVDEGNYGYIIHEDTTEIAEALIKAIVANPKLKCLDLSDSYRCLEWSSHFQDIFKAMEEHKGLRTFVVKELAAPVYDSGNDDSDDECLDPNPAPYDWLVQLLSRNRNIAVCYKSGHRCSDGPRIDQLYLLNSIFNRSPELVKESTSVRPMLVATALVDSASEKFQHTALLLSNHPDMLCELIQGLNLDEEIVSEETLSAAAIRSDQADSFEQDAEIQPPPKKASRNEA